MNPSIDFLKTMQLEFLSSAAHWVNHGKEVEPSIVDLPSIVNLLQSIGYKISRIDCVAPNDTPLLKDGKKGVRVVITCNHSGQRCVLELPEEQCKCMKEIKCEQNTLWEIEATANNLSYIETGSGIIPPISKNLNNLLKNVLNILVHMIQGPFSKFENVYESTNSISSSVSSSATSSPKKDARRLSAYLKDMANPPIILNSSKEPYSPSRYGSLDTLNKTEDQNAASNATTYQILTSPNKTQSSPNIHFLDKNEATPGNSLTKGDFNNKIIQLLQRAIFLLQANKCEEKSPLGKPLPTKIISPLRRRAFSTTKTPIVSKATTKSLPTRTPVRTPLYTVLKTTRELRQKTPEIEREEKSKNALVKPKRVNSLYAHVKSTIPKPLPSTKIEKKN